VAAVVVLIIGANAVVELTQLDRRGERVTATVLDGPSPTLRAEGSFTAQYVTARGEQITTEISRYDVAPKAGDKVEIVYDPDDPKVAKTVDAWETPWVPGIAYGAGAVLLTWIALRRQRTTDRPGQARRRITG
jgi:hypothetical protein